MENLIVEVGNYPRKPSTMKDDMQKRTDSPVHEIGLTLDELIKRGARQVIQQAIEAELAELLVTHANVITLQGKRAVVRNGYVYFVMIVDTPLSGRITGFLACSTHRNVIEAPPKRTPGTFCVTD